MIDKFKEFARDNVGKVYNFSKYNCEHLTIDGLKKIHGIEVDGLSVDNFKECDITEAQIFACEDENGLSCHVGLLSGGAHLHAVGKPLQESGQVMMHNKSYFNRVFKPLYLAVRYYKYVAN